MLFLNEGPVFWNIINLIIYLKNVMTGISTNENVFIFLQTIYDD